MKMVKFCAVLNLFALLVALQGLGSEDQGNEADLSARSQKVYNQLQDADSKTIYLETYFGKRRLAKDNSILKKDNSILKKDKRDLQSKLGYNEFLCAAGKLKSQPERIFPNFLGEWINGTNPTYNRFMNRLYVRRNPLIEEARRFEKKEDSIVNRKHWASQKMWSFYRQMYAMLTRYNLPKYKGCITNESCQYAEKILEKIIHPPFPNGGFNRIIEDFSRRYAHIRHCYNFFGHHLLTLLDNVILDLENALENKAQKLRLCEVLEHMGILELWQFTKDDIDAMNYISYANNGKQIYYSHTCNCMIGDNTIEVLIPLTATDNCPIL